jgi:hypothetical protein
MFRKILSKDELPYSSEGMTTKKWKDLSVWRIPIDILIATQDGVYFHGLAEEYTHLHDEFVHVVYHDGEYYLEDGHHRVVKARLRGAQSVLARVLCLRS